MRGRQQHDTTQRVIGAAEVAIAHLSACQKQPSESVIRALLHRELQGLTILVAVVWSLPRLAQLIKG
jgi:hypothetical protein